MPKAKSLSDLLLDSRMQFAISEAKDKELFLILGKTGVGKSTIANYLLGHSLTKCYEPSDEIEEVDEKEFKINLKQETDLDATAYAEIGHTGESHTLYPGVYENFCDLPGFNDNRYEEGICVSIGTELVVRSAACIKAILIVMTYEQIKADRQDYIVEILNMLNKLLKNSVSHQKSIFFIVNKIPPNKKLDSLKAILINTLKKKQKDLSLSKDKLFQSIQEKLAYNLEEAQEKLYETLRLINFIEYITENINNLIILDVLDDGTSKKNLLQMLNQLDHPIPKEAFDFKSYDEKRQKFDQLIYSTADKGIGLLQNAIAISREIVYLNGLLNSSKTEEEIFVEKINPLLSKITNKDDTLSLSEEIKKEFCSYLETQINNIEKEINKILNNIDDIKSINANVKEKLSKINHEEPYLIEVMKVKDSRRFLGNIPVFNRRTKEKMIYKHKISFLYAEKYLTNGEFKDEISSPRDGTYQITYESEPGKDGEAEIKIFIKMKDKPDNKLQITNFEEEIKRNLQRIDQLEKQLSDALSSKKAKISAKESIRNISDNTAKDSKEIEALHTYINQIKPSEKIADLQQKIKTCKVNLNDNHNKIDENDRLYKLIIQIDELLNYQQNSSLITEFINAYKIYSQLKNQLEKTPTDVTKKILIKKEIIEEKIKLILTEEYTNKTFVKEALNTIKDFLEDNKMLNSEDTCEIYGYMFLCQAASEEQINARYEYVRLAFDNFKRIKENYQEMLNLFIRLIASECSHFITNKDDYFVKLLVNYLPFFWQEIPHSHIIQRIPAVIWQKVIYYLSTDYKDKIFPHILANIENANEPVVKQQLLLLRHNEKSLLNYILDNRNEKLVKKIFQVFIHKASIPLLELLYQLIFLEQTEYFKYILKRFKGEGKFKTASSEHLKQIENILNQNLPNGQTLLIVAIQHKRKEAIKILLENNADSNKQCLHEISNSITVIEKKHSLATADDVLNIANDKTDSNSTKIQLLKAQEILPELKESMFGKLANNEGCIFDALAQLLHNSNRLVNCDEKTLRRICHDFYVNNKKLVDSWNQINYQENNGEYIYDNTVKARYENKSSSQSKIDELLNVIGDVPNASISLLNQNIFISREEIALSIINSNNHYTADFINLLLYFLTEKVPLIKNYPAATLETLLSYYENILSQKEEPYSFIPLNVAFDEKEAHQKNHWVAFVIDKQHRLIFYLDPAQETNIPQQITMLKSKLDYQEATILNPINFQQNEIQDGCIRHCGPYIIEIFKCFLDYIQKGVCISGSILPNPSISNSVAAQTAFSSIPCGEIEFTHQIRKNHIEIAHAVLVKTVSFSAHEVQESQPSKSKALANNLELISKHNNYIYVQYTKQQLENLFTDKTITLIKGRPYVEGRILCCELNLPGICIVQIYEDPNSSIISRKFLLVTANQSVQRLSEEDAIRKIKTQQYLVIVFFQNNLCYVPLYQTPANRPFDLQIVKKENPLSSSLMSPLRLAILTDEAEIVSLLLKYKANIVHDINEHGKNLLHIAGRNTAIFRLLWEKLKSEERKLLITQNDKDNYTPIHNIIEVGNAKLLNWLIANIGEANLTIKDIENILATTNVTENNNFYHLAVKSNSLPMIKIVYNESSSVPLFWHKNKQGHTPLLLAKVLNNKAIKADIKTKIIKDFKGNLINGIKSQFDNPTKDQNLNEYIALLNNILNTNKEIRKKIITFFESNTLQPKLMISKLAKDITLLINPIQNTVSEISGLQINPISKQNSLINCIIDFLNEALKKESTAVKSVQANTNVLTTSDIPEDTSILEKLRQENDMLKISLSNMDRHMRRMMSLTQQLIQVTCSNPEAAKNIASALLSELNFSHYIDHEKIVGDTTEQINPTYKR